MRELHIGRCDELWIEAVHHGPAERSAESIVIRA